MGRAGRCKALAGDGAGATVFLMTGARVAAGAAFFVAFAAAFFVAFATCFATRAAFLGLVVVLRLTAAFLTAFFAATFLPAVLAFLVLPLAPRPLAPAFLAVFFADALLGFFRFVAIVPSSAHNPGGSPPLAAPSSMNQARLATMAKAEATGISRELPTGPRQTLDREKRGGGRS
jgi:hypothetical protein